tara:strand:- start:125 stop:901 length:777 start_codon:yes stop_codon:yes gene_type:complete
MASAYSTDLQLELVATGEKAGLWGTITNSNLKILELAASGYLSTPALATGNLTLQLDAGSSLGLSTATGKNLMIEVTGTLTASRVITMPVGSERIFIIKDSTVRSTSNFIISVQNVGANAAGTITLPVGSTCMLYTDGTGVDSMKLLSILEKGTVSVGNSVNSPYTAIAGDIVLGEVGNGGGGTINVVLPGSPIAGDKVTVMDSSVVGGFASNNCTIGRNGQPIQGAAADFVMDLNNQSITFVYTNATKGWQIKSTNT